MGILVSVSQIGIIMDKFCLKWNDLEGNIRNYFSKLRKEQELFDVTLASDDGKHMQAHKIILSAASCFFSDIFMKSSKSNDMLIYLKGITGSDLADVLDFIYNGEAFVSQDEIKHFLETGQELKIIGLEGELLDIAESNPNESKTTQKNNITEPEYKNSDDSTFQINVFNDIDVQVDGSGFRNHEVFQRNSINELDDQIFEMIEKNEGVWKCKVCRKSATSQIDIKRHAEIHIGGMSHNCRICNKSYPNRESLRVHISQLHSELVSCGICGKSGMTKKTFYNHRRTKH